MTTLKVISFGTTLRCIEMKLARLHVMVLSEFSEVLASAWALTAVVLVWETITSQREVVRRRCCGFELSAM